VEAPAEVGALREWGYRGCGLWASVALEAHSLLNVAHLLEKIKMKDDTIATMREDLQHLLDETMKKSETIAKLTAEITQLRDIANITITLADNDVNEDDAEMIMPMDGIENTLNNVTYGVLEHVHTPARRRRASPLTNSP